MAEFAQRGIAARPGHGGVEHSVRATINNVEVDIRFHDGGVTWQGNDGRMHRRAGDSAPGTLADAVIDSLLNPA